MKQFVKVILMLALMLAPVAGWTAEAVGQTAPAEAAAKEEHHGLTAHPLTVFRLGPFAVTNSMMITLIVTICMVVFAQVVSRHVRPVPQGAQNFMEWTVESLYTFVEDVLGAALTKQTFWFFGTIFLFILTTNWFGLIPGVGTIGWGYHDPQGEFHLTEPWLRGGNADLNMTSAMALMFFALWIYWAWRANGVVGTYKHIFAPDAGGSGAMALFMMAIFFGVGILEVISILFRPVSLSFRLYGNVFAGENMLESMMNLVPWLGWIIPLPFYFLEMLVGLVQALVFMLLTAVFTLLICQHDDGKHGHGAEKGQGHAH